MRQYCHIGRFCQCLTHGGITRMGTSPLALRHPLPRGLRPASRGGICCLWDNAGEAVSGAKHHMGASTGESQIRRRPSHGACQALPETAGRPRTGPSCRSGEHDCHEKSRHEILLRVASAWRRLSNALPESIIVISSVAHVLCQSMPPGPLCSCRARTVVTQNPAILNHAMMIISPVAHVLCQSMP